MAAHYEWWVELDNLLADNTGEQSPKVQDVQSSPDTAVITKSGCGRGVGVGDADGLCEKKVCMLATS